MATTKVDHLILTVTTVKVFVETMQFINEFGLWDDARAYLKRMGKTEMFVDFEVLHHFREMLKEHTGFDPNHPAFRLIEDHQDPTKRFRQS